MRAGSRQSGFAQLLDAFAGQKRQGQRAETAIAKKQGGRHVPNLAAGMAHVARHLPIKALAGIIEIMPLGLEVDGCTNGLFQRGI